MGEKTAPSTTTAAVTIPSSSLRNNNSIRFLGLLKQPDPDSTQNHPLELDESDVIWSSDLSYDSSSAVESVDPYSPSSSPSTYPDPSSYSPSNSHHRRRRSNHHHHRPFVPEKFGLSAAFAEDSISLVHQRKPALDPTVSAASAARIVPVSVPMTVPRSGSEEVLRGQGKLFQHSAPVNVPAWPRRKGRGVHALDDVEDVVVEDEEEEEMLPPHVIVARSHVSNFSVFEGVGRTLKGRDLRRVRNAIMQKTGFLD